MVILLHCDGDGYSRYELSCSIKCYMDYCGIGRSRSLFDHICVSVLGSMSSGYDELHISYPFSRSECIRLVEYLDNSCDLFDRIDFVIHSGHRLFANNFNVRLLSRVLIYRT